MMDQTIPVARIESRPFPDRYARGWYCLGLSRHYSDTPKALDYFGTKLVAYRGEDMQVHILDAYCPHMGADLSKGCVSGNNILCPFHDWSWGADGFCNHIPYAQNIPKRARIKSWPTLEKNGLLYVWHDHEGNPPIPDQMIPQMDEYYSDEWSDWHMSEIRIHNNGRELIDNMADVGHFGPVHNAHAMGFRNEVEGHTFTQVMEGDPDKLERADSLWSRATYYGPAVMTTHMKSASNGLIMETRLLVTHVPVDHQNFDLRFGLLVKRFPAFGRDLNDFIMQRYVDSTTESFLQDVAIWHNKVRVDNPVLCDGDGPINKLRQWYEQFYMDVADVPKEWGEKKEYVTM
ncbi:MAG TPA: Rieske 2Fe-2S domain-containing protein [Pseudomonadales bacterium]|jgi:3-ketosteroid 9alpha-monooxygenase subunit A